MLRARSIWESRNLRPIRRLTAKTVFWGLVIAWRLAICPTRRSPSSEKATIDAVVRLPSRFASTTGTVASTIVAQLFVVPRSIPRILLMVDDGLKLPYCTWFAENPQGRPYVAALGSWAGRTQGGH